MYYNAYLNYIQQCNKTNTSLKFALLNVDLSIAIISSTLDQFSIEGIIIISQLSARLSFTPSNIL